MSTPLEPLRHPPAQAEPRAASWRGHLQLSYRRDGDSTRAHDRHEGPLRVLKSLYPEGSGICHHTLVHPPGGMAGGDTLAMDLALGPQSHAVLTTPGATRFYRTLGPRARQQVQAHVQSGARLEWVPLENIAYPGAQVDNHQRFTLDPGAQMLGWDLLALGLPAADNGAWTQGHIHQRVDIPGLWLEQGRIDAQDRRLLQSPLGWAGHRAMATLWWAAGPADHGEPSPPVPADPAWPTTALLDAARNTLATWQGEPTAATRELPGRAGVTSPHPRLVVLRALAPRVEPLMALLRAVRLQWREAAWGLPPCEPRVWRT